MCSTSTPPESETPSDKLQTRNVPKIEAGIATAEHIRKDWEARGCPGPSLLARMFEIDANPALANDPELIKKFQRITALLDPEEMKASAAMAAQAIAACAPPPDVCLSFLAAETFLPKMWQNDAWTRQYANMALALADLDSNSMQASAAAAAQAIAVYLPLLDAHLPYVAELATVAKMLQEDTAWMGRYAATAFKLEVEYLKAEEAWKTTEHAAGFPNFSRLAEEISRAESYYESNAIKALFSSYTPPLDSSLGRCATCTHPKRQRPNRDRT